MREQLENTACFPYHIGWYTRQGNSAAYNRLMHRRQFLQTANALPAFAGAAALAAKTSHRVMAQDKKHVAAVNPDGSVDWVWENGTVAHDMHLLKNGNVLVPTLAQHYRRSDSREGSDLAMGVEAGGRIRRQHRDSRL